MSVETATPMTAEPHSRRLDRIEQKIDMLGEAMVNMARLEEKIGALKTELSRLYRDQKSTSEELARLTIAVADNARTSSWVNRIAYAVLAAGAVAFASQFVPMPG